MSRRSRPEPPAPVVAPAGDPDDAWFVALRGAQPWRGLLTATWHASPDDRRQWTAGPEESVLALGPPRSGKTSTLVVPNLWIAPAAAVSTSTKPDVLSATLASRRLMGTCYVFDPTSSTPVPEGAEELRWSPLVGSETWDGAVSMARALVRAARPGAARHPEAQHWNDRAEALLAPVLHAAAADRRSMAEVCRWVLSHDVREPEAILSLTGATLAKVSLSSVWRTEERERSGIFSTASGLLSVYRSEGALALTARPNFDPDRFAASRDTLYVCAPGHAQDEMAPLVVALLEQVRDACYQRRRRHPDSAPVVFLLDEVANIAPLPGLAQLVSEGGGQGVVTLACLQDLSQARARWGQEADGFFSLFGTKVIFPGIADQRTLELVSALGGEHQVAMRSVSQPVRPSMGRALLELAAGVKPSAPPRPVVTTSTTFRRRLAVEEVHRGRPGCVLLLSPRELSYAPVEPWSRLADLEQMFGWFRMRSIPPHAEQPWPVSPWATAGPRVLERRLGPDLVVVRGQPLPAATPVVEHDGGQEAPEESRIDRGGSAITARPTRTPATAPDLHGYRALVRVMGPPELAGGAEIPERDKAVELACILSLHPHRSMTSEELRAALWPGDLGEPGVTAKSLRNTASLLRKSLGLELFPEARRGAGYQLSDAVGCDWTIFSELTEAVLGPDEPDMLRRALSMVRGAPFEGVKSGTYGWAWTEHFVSQIGRGVRTASYRFCQLSLDRGDHDAAAWAALQALMVDPYDHRLWDLYLQASACSGRRALEQAWKEARGVLGGDAEGLRGVVEGLTLRLLDRAAPPDVETGGGHRG